MRYVGWSILAVVVGIPGLLFISVLSFGAVSAPFVGLLFLVMQDRGVGPMKVPMEDLVAEGKKAR